MGMAFQGPRAAALVGALVCRRPVIARASDGKEDSGEGGLSPKGARTEQVALPIFPLGNVAMPCGSMPLHIFEARYRVLFATLLEGSEGVNTDLVDVESPFKGTRRFGMCWLNGQGSMAATGTELHIDAHQMLPDGRMLVESTGRRRFRVRKVVKEKPVMVCEVEYLDSEEEAGPGEDEGDAVRELAQEVLTLFRNVTELNFKLRGLDSGDVARRIDFQAKARMSPREISFWVASMFSDAESEQQFLLEMDGSELRLQREKSLLSEAQKFLSAQAALKSVFSSGESSGSGSGSKGDE